MATKVALHADFGHGVAPARRPTRGIVLAPSCGVLITVLSATLPHSRTRAVSTLALFAAVQFADGVMTYLGVVQLGPAAEGNPILAFYMAACGVGTTLVCAKLVALGLAAILWATSNHLSLAMLTTLYVLAAIGPWALLTPF